MRDIAQAAWDCADPGMQYDTTINDWHTCSNTGPINASNPCSEYMHLDDSACNLASINLLKFLDEEGSFDVEAYKRTIAVSIMAQEIIVANSSYPTEKIDQNAIAFRQLGLGYSNLGALLMCLGIPYDSDEGRAWCGALTAIMTGHGYATSAAIAARIGPFAGYETNREPMLRVIEKHRDAVDAIPDLDTTRPLAAGRGARLLGRRARARPRARLPQLAGDGDRADRHDQLHDGLRHDRHRAGHRAGEVQEARRRRDDEDRQQHSAARARARSATTSRRSTDIIAYIDETGTIEGAPHLAEEHLPVFDCAFRPQNGMRTIHWLGHVKMMGAAQPFISGAISKTVNLPEEATVEEIEQAYIEGWKHGLKALAIYRDGSKRAQVLSTKKDDGSERRQRPRTTAHPVRRRLPATRTSVTHKFSIEGHEGYITVGLYEDGKPGEIWLTMAKEGSTLSGMMDAFATSISLALQYGVPLRDLVNKFSHMRFEPTGRTENREIPVAQSIVDYIFRWLASQFLSEDEKEEFGVLSPAVKAKMMAAEYGEELGAGSQTSGNGNGKANGTQTDAPPCANCGWIMTRAGTCYKCDNCGSTTGCG